MSDEKKVLEIKKRPVVSSVPKMDKPIKKKSLKIEKMAEMFINEIISDEIMRFHFIADGVNVPVRLPQPGEVQQCKVWHENLVLEYLGIIGERLHEEFAEDYQNAHILLLSDKTARQLLATIRIKSKMLRKLQSVEIAPFAFLSDESLTFCRIPFDILDEDVETPTWDRFFENLSNAQAVKAFIGSLFVPGSDRSQYLWIYGNGGNGKTTIANIISKVFGQFVRFEHAPCTKFGEDKFWTHGLLNKRLVVIDDCDRPEFVRSGLFKSITGTSRCRVEEKGKPAYDAEFTCKFFITSNEEPKISEETSDQRRIIFSKTKNTKPFPHEPDFEKKLISEMPGFISQCYGVYFSMCKGGRTIPTDTKEALELAADFSEELDVFADENFTFTGKDTDFVCLGHIISKAKECGIRKGEAYKALEKRGAKRSRRAHSGVRGMTGLTPVHRVGF